ncbi:uncharacterized protein PAC_06087 [Phialocephala subalpina]|uniref:SET domain-containing protein n=1 Tax=Phialocephala subalpina TaxID=576137 RepID=A0A1L7WTY4_9HELO|nr:uncharacterized protein PAC_06087 [Phialocephala subalpina]
MQSTICDRLYIIQEIPGKDYGLVAATTVTKGTRILSESPLFRKVATLWEEQRQAFLSLRNSFEDEDGLELGRVQTNALPLGSDATTSGILLDSSRINHSCNTNTQNTWNENLQKLTIHTIQDITKGDEIIIFSLPAETAAPACTLCRPTSTLLVPAVSAPCPLTSARRAIKDGTRSRGLTTQLVTEQGEGLVDASVPRAYYDAFQIAITHGDITRAKVSAERAASTREILVGNDSPMVQRMKSLARNLSQHMADGYSMKWRTAEDDIPRELSKNEFEPWLWKKEIAEVPQYADLRSETAFPAFDSLLEENEISLEFYESADEVSYRPRKNWCSLAEIIDVEKFLRLRLIVKGKSGRAVPIAFYTDDRGLELDPSYAQEGFTVGDSLR